MLTYCYHNIWHIIIHKKIIIILFSITISFSSTRPRYNPDLFRPQQFIITDEVTLTIIMKSHRIMTHSHIKPPSFLFCHSWIPSCFFGSWRLLTCTDQETDVFSPGPIGNAQCPQSYLRAAPLSSVCSHGCFVMTMCFLVLPPRAHKSTD